MGVYFYFGRYLNLNSNLIVILLATIVLSDHTSNMLNKKRYKN